MCGVCVYVFIYLSIDRPLDFPHILAVMNNTEMNMRVQISLKSCFVSLGYKVRLLYHMAVLFLIIFRNHHTGSPRAVSIYIPTKNAQGFAFLHILTNTFFSSF